jgi:hypothetical protein
MKNGAGIAELDVNFGDTPNGGHQTHTLSQSSGCTVFCNYK